MIYVNKVGNHVHRTKFEEDCLFVKGTGVFHEDVVTEEIKITGHCQVKGKLFATELINWGSAILKSCHVKHFKNIGSITVHRLESNVIETSGYFQCKTEVKTDTFQSKGTIRIQQLYARDHIKLKIGTACKIVTMKCQKRIDVKPFVLPLLMKKLTVNTIEGEHINLENTVANHVIGENITIGPNCKISKISYKNDLTIHPNSTVVSSEKI